MTHKQNSQRRSSPDAVKGGGAALLPVPSPEDIYERDQALRRRVLRQKNSRCAIERLQGFALEKIINELAFGNHVEIKAGRA